MAWTFTGPSNLHVNFLCCYSLNMYPRMDGTEAELWSNHCCSTQADSSRPKVLGQANMAKTPLVKKILPIPPDVYLLYRQPHGRSNALCYCFGPICSSKRRTCCGGFTKGLRCSQAKGMWRKDTAVAYPEQKMSANCLLICTVWFGDTIFGAFIEITKDLWHWP